MSSDNSTTQQTATDNRSSGTVPQGTLQQQTTQRQGQQGQTGVAATQQPVQTVQLRLPQGSVLLNPLQTVQTAHQIPAQNQNQAPLTAPLQNNITVPQGILPQVIPPHTAPPQNQQPPVVINPNQERVHNPVTQQIQQITQQIQQLAANSQQNAQVQQNILQLTQQLQALIQLPQSFETDQLRQTQDTTPDENTSSSMPTMVDMYMGMQYILANNQKTDADVDGSG